MYRTQNLQTLEGNSLCILQQFETKNGNFTDCKMHFQAVVIDFESSCHDKYLFYNEILPVILLRIIPASCPSNVGLVATFKPGCGMRKQERLSKHDLM